MTTATHNNEYTPSITQEAYRKKEPGILSPKLLPTLSVAETERGLVGRAAGVEFDASTKAYSSSTATDLLSLPLPRQASKKQNTGVYL